jgi:hypothetical protein
MSSFNSRELYFQRYTSKAPHKELVGVELGEQWTYQGVIQQGIYLAEYTKSPKRQAAWLLGLSACIADDETTFPRMSEAIAAGLPLLHACSIAVMSNSRQGAKALVQLGVNWSTQTIVPTQERWANDDKNIDQPNAALIESVIEPERALGRFRKDVPLQNALDAAILNKRSNFIEGALEGGLNGSIQLPSSCLGLESDRVRVLSLLIANGLWDLAVSAINEDQDTLDEALLACAMCCTVELSTEDRMRQGHLALDLIAKGANPDRPFTFGLEASRPFENGFASLMDYENATGSITARQWAISGALFHEQDGVRAIEQAFMTRLPSLSPPDKLRHGDVEPMPALWPFWAMCMSRSSKDYDDNGASANTLRILLDERPLSMEHAAAFLKMALDQAQNDGWKSFDGFRQSKAFDLVKGSVSREQVVELISDACGSNPLNPSICKLLWSNPRLDNLIDLMPEADGALWHVSFENWLRTVRIEMKKDNRGWGAPRLSAKEEEVIKLTFQSSLEAFSSRTTASPRPRRSL